MWLASLSPSVPRRRATLYGQWARLLEAGLPAGQVATLLERQPERSVAGALGRAAGTALRGEAGLGEALRRVDGLPTHHPALVEAGEASGTLPRVLERLAADSELEAVRRRRLLASLAYPALVFFVAGIVLPLPSLVVGDSAGALATALPLLAIPIGGIAVLAAGARAAARGSGWPARVPGLAALIDLAARARWCRVTARLLGAGLALPATLQAAAEAAGDGPVGRDALRVAGDVRRGRGLGEAVNARALLTPESAPLAAEADAVGTAESAYSRAATLIEADLDEKLKWRTRILGAAAYLLAAGFVAFKVISFWAGHFAGRG